MIQIQGLSERQKILADLLWLADSQEDADEIVRKFGHDARVVRDMILCAVIDEATESETEFKTVKEIIDSVK